MKIKNDKLRNYFLITIFFLFTGGGVLAHTILGVDWDEAGNIAWLVLDLFLDWIFSVKSISRIFFSIFFAG